MDFLITGFLYWVFNLFNPDTKGSSGSGGIFFMFGDERGCNQPDNDPFLNSDYDNGPDW